MVRVHKALTKLQACFFFFCGGFCAWVFYLRLRVWEDDYMGVRYRKQREQLANCSDLFCFFFGFAMRVFQCN